MAIRLPPLLAFAATPAAYLAPWVVRGCPLRLRLVQHAFEDAGLGAWVAVLSTAVVAALLLHQMVLRGEPASGADCRLGWAVLPWLLACPIVLWLGISSGAVAFARSDAWDVVGEYSWRVGNLQVARAAGAGGSAFLATAVLLYQRTTVATRSKFAITNVLVCILAFIDAGLMANALDWNAERASLQLPSALLESIVFSRYLLVGFAIYSALRLGLFAWRRLRKAKRTASAFTIGIAVACICDVSTIELVERNSIGPITLPACSTIAGASPLTFTPGRWPSEHGPLFWGARAPEAVACLSRGSLVSAAGEQLSFSDFIQNAPETSNARAAVVLGREATPSDLLGLLRAATEQGRQSILIGFAGSRQEDLPSAMAYLRERPALTPAILRFEYYLVHLGTFDRDHPASVSVEAVNSATKWILSDLRSIEAQRPAIIQSCRRGADPRCPRPSELMPSEVNGSTPPAVEWSGSLADLLRHGQLAPTRDLPISLAVDADSSPQALGQILLEALGTRGVWGVGGDGPHQRSIMLLVPESLLE